MWGLNEDEEEMYIGYVDGEWIELTCTVDEDYTETFTYVKDGKTIVYYVR